MLESAGFDFTSFALYTFDDDYAHDVDDYQNATTGRIEPVRYTMWMMHHTHVVQ